MRITCMMIAGISSSSATQDLDSSPSHLGGALNDYPCGGPAALFSWIRHSGEESLACCK